jgi:hypothetical protein
MTTFAARTNDLQEHGRHSQHAAIYFEAGVINHPNSRWRLGYIYFKNSHIKQTDYGNHIPNRHG